MRHLALSGLSLLALAACGGSPTDPDGGAHDAPAIHPDTGALDGGGLDAGAQDSGIPIDAAPGPDAPASADCLAYCECFERDCASIQTIPGGSTCLDFCATFTAEQWDCRISHCRLVVPESNPGHCMHAVGIDQCL